MQTEVGSLGRGDSSPHSLGRARKAGAAGARPCRASRWVPGEVSGDRVRLRLAGHSEESGGQQERHGTQF